MKVPPPETGLPTAELDTETYTVTVPAGADVLGCEEPPAEEPEFEEPDELEESLEEEELDPEPAFEDEAPFEEGELPGFESEELLAPELSEEPSPSDFDSSLLEASFEASFLSSDSPSALSALRDASLLSAFASSALSADELSTLAERTIPTLSAALTTRESAGRPKPPVKANPDAAINSTDTTARAAMPTRVAEESAARFGSKFEVAA